VPELGYEQRRRLRRFMRCHLLRELPPAAIAQVLSDARRPERVIDDEEAKVNHMPKNRPALRSASRRHLPPEISARPPPAIIAAGGSSGRRSTGMKNRSSLL